MRSKFEQDRDLGLKTLHTGHSHVSFAKGRTQRTPEITLLRYSLVHQTNLLDVLQAVA
jgi:hypothetical protein